MNSSHFIDTEVVKCFSNNGFVLIKNFLSSNEIEQLRILFNDCYNYKGEEQGMWNSLYNLPKDFSLNVSQKILGLLIEKLEQTFNSFKCPVASFMVKNPNKNGITDLHRDYSTQDESRFQYRNIWIPLVDTNAENGTLYALKYSHTFFNYPLPMFCKWPYIDHQTALFKVCDIIDAKAGDLVVYADRTLHGSFINQTSTPRPVVHLGLLHPDSELCYYYLDTSTNEVTVYDVPFEFFFENNFGNQVGKFPIERKFIYAPPFYKVGEIMKGLQISQ
jgi:hypothetical protein